MNTHFDPKLRSAGSGHCEHDGLLARDTALAIDLKDVVPLADTELVHLSAAAGRVTAATIGSTTALPRFDNAALDGYGLHESDLAKGAPLMLPLADRVAAGQGGERSMLPGSAVRILTGARISAGVAAVVGQERTTASDSLVVVETVPEPGANIRRRGEDVLVEEPGSGRCISLRCPAIRSPLS